MTKFIIMLAVVLLALAGTGCPRQSASQPNRNPPPPVQHETPAPKVAPMLPTLEATLAGIGGATV